MELELPPLPPPPPGASHLRRGILFQRKGVPETSPLAFCSVSDYKWNCKANTIRNYTKYIHVNLSVKRLGFCWFTERCYLRKKKGEVNHFF